MKGEGEDLCACLGRRLGAPMRLWRISGLVGVKHGRAYLSGLKVAVSSLDLSIQGVRDRWMSVLLCVRHL